MLEAQRTQAVLDLETLTRHQRQALAAPVSFVEQLQKRVTAADAWSASLFLDPFPRPWRRSVNREIRFECVQLFKISHSSYTWFLITPIP